MGMTTRKGQLFHCWFTSLRSSTTILNGKLRSLSQPPRELTRRDCCAQSCGASLRVCGLATLVDVETWSQSTTNNDNNKLRKQIV